MQGNSSPPSTVFLKHMSMFLCIDHESNQANIYIINKYLLMLNLAGKNLKNITEKEIEKSSTIKHLDASYNELSKGIDFQPLTNLMTLVIDDNRFTILTDFPPFPQLETFSANKNDFSDLALFLDEGFDRFKNIKNLSMLKNPLNPFFEGEQKYIIYRDRVLQNFQKLKTMDGCAVSIMKKQMQQKKFEEEEKYEKLKGVVTFDAKIAENQLKSVKTRSEGHRFVKNNQL